MQKDAFYQAAVGGIRFDGVLSADGPYIEACSVAGNRPIGGVALVVSQGFRTKGSVATVCLRGVT